MPSAPFSLAIMLTAVLGLAFLPSVPAQATFPTSTTPSIKAVNPALLYWQSIGLQQEMTRPEHQLLHAFRNGKAWEVDKAQALLGHQKAAIARFLKASSSPVDCDWGFTLEDGPFLPLPHLNRMQNLGNLVLLKAAVSFAANRPETALEEIHAVRQAARHVGDGQLLITCITQFAMETEAVNFLARHALSLEEAHRRQLLADAPTLPPLRTTAEAVAGERGFTLWVEQQATEAAALMLLESMTHGQTGNAASSGESMPAASPATPTSAALPATHPYASLTAENLKAWLEEMRLRYEEAQAALALPWRESQQALQALQTRLEAGNPLVKSIFPSLQASRDTQARTETLLTMLDLALHHGHQLDESHTAAAKDAFEGRPLKLHREPDGGYSLLADHTVRGRQVKLRFPAAPPTKTAK